VTEIPEHLLKRSKERRSALGLPGGEGDDGGSGGAAEEAKPAAAPATAAPAPAPAKVEEKPPPPPKPKPAYVQAAEKRRRIPYWAMPVIALLPVWAFVYAQGMKTPEVQDEQLALGAEVYGSCSGCHGPAGEGATGPQLSDGEVLATWPDPVGMMEWIHVGGEAWTGTVGGSDYGDPEREGGAHNVDTHSGPMPAFGALTADELAAVTRYVRESLGGAPPATPELQALYHEWAELAITNAEAGDLVYGTTEPDPDRIAQAAGEG